VLQLALGVLVLVPPLPLLALPLLLLARLQRRELMIPHLRRPATSRSDIVLMRKVHNHLAVPRRFELRVLSAQVRSCARDLAFDVLFVCLFV
jgi:hypothetical protein